MNSRMLSMQGGYLNWLERSAVKQRRKQPAY